MDLLVPSSCHFFPPDHSISFLRCRGDPTVRRYLSSQKHTSNSKPGIHLMLSCSTLVTSGMGAWKIGAVGYLLNGSTRTSLDVQLWNNCGRLHTSSAGMRVQSLVSELRSYMSWCGQKKSTLVAVMWHLPQDLNSIGAKKFALLFTFLIPCLIHSRP